MPQFKFDSLHHIVAASNNRVIGKDNRLPWHFSADLKRFKELTVGNTIIMGRKTFESIGKPLPGRDNFVLSKTKEGTESGVRFFKSIEDALEAVNTKKAFVIGGADLFKQTIDQADGIYLTQVNGDYEGDTFYPEIPKNFQETSRQVSLDEPQLEFIHYTNTRAKAKI